MEDKRMYNRMMEILRTRAAMGEGCNEDCGGGRKKKRGKPRKAKRGIIPPQLRAWHKFMKQNPGLSKQELSILYKRKK